MDTLTLARSWVRTAPSSPASPSDVEHALRAFEQVLMDAEHADGQKLADALRADGLTVDAAGHITAPTALDGAIDPHALEDPDVFVQHSISKFVKAERHGESAHLFVD